MGFEDAIEGLPAGAQVAITASPEKGLELTIDRSIWLAERSFRVIPHVTARSVRDREHATEIAKRLGEAAINDVFVPGGDNEEPAGEFTSSYELLDSLNELGLLFDSVGITGYPEGHPFIDDETLYEELHKKEPYATYIVTQLCFDPDAIIDWIDSIRDRGVELPVYIGIPGVMKYQRMISISRKVGVGDSIRFLQKTTGILDFARQLIGSGGRYEPDALIEGLSAFQGSDHHDIAGVHLYTFNQVADIESWRQANMHG